MKQISKDLLVAAYDGEGNLVETFGNAGEYEAGDKLGSRLFVAATITRELAEKAQSFKFFVLDSSAFKPIIAKKYVIE